MTVVNNNGGGNQSKRGFDRVYADHDANNRSRELWTYRSTNFAKIAEDMGALGIRVEKASDIAPALKQALAANRPVVIDIATDLEALAPTAVA